MSKVLQVFKGAGCSRGAGVKAPVVQRVVQQRTPQQRMPVGSALRGPHWCVLHPVPLFEVFNDHVIGGGVVHGFTFLIVMVPISPLCRSTTRYTPAETLR